MADIMIRSIDFETSQQDGGPPDNEVVEAGWTDIHFNTETKEVLITKPMNLLFRPIKPMSSGTIAIHHLTMSRLKDAPTCKERDLKLLVESGKPDFITAHNTEFEGRWLTPAILGPVRMICTMKAARRAWPDIPHNLQALKYERGLEDLPEDLCMPPHRAGPDSYVGAYLFAEMAREFSINQLVRWTLEPREYLTCPLTAHKGKTWDLVPASYLKWMLGAPDMEADLKHAASSELRRRDEAALARQQRDVAEREPPQPLSDTPSGT